MKRRDFLKKSAAAGVAVAALPAIGGHSVNALAKSPSLKAMDQLTADSDRIFVLVNLFGGNDGLNTIVPVENNLYYERRSNLAIAKNATLPLNETLGWNSNLTGMKQLFDEEKLAVVQGVTYPNPNRSHFRGTDIWLTASDADVFLSSGWLGRFLEPQFPDYPTELPEDPIAVQIGSKVSLGFQSDGGNMAISFRDAEEFYELMQRSQDIEGSEEPPETAAGVELDYVRTIHSASRLYSSRVNDAFEPERNAVEYPNSQLAQSLQIVANLIAGGLKTKFYLVSIGGFDTHANQSAAHTNLLTQVSSSIKAFMEDLDALDLGDKVAGMTFSEFGRRVQENGSLGTDHGSAAPLFVFGNQVLGNRVHGGDPDLENLDNRGDLLMQHDFRQIYASVLAQWFGSTDNDIQEVLMGEFSELPLFREDSGPTSVAEAGASQPMLLQNYPNPAARETTIEYALPERSYVTLALMDARGAILTRLVAAEQGPGTYKIPVVTSSLPAGNYFYRLRAGRHSDTKRMQILR